MLGINFRPVFMVIGITLVTIAVFMTIPALVDYIQARDEWRNFGISAMLTLFIGLSMMTAFFCPKPNLNVRQGFLTTTLTWVFLALFSALPFYLCLPAMSYTDAFFESMSGITTTGATVLRGLDTLSPGILLWRGLLQWIGGLGIIVMAIAVLPMLRVGGMQMFRMESSDQSGKILPRATQISALIATIYVALSVLWMIAFWCAGMNGLEAVVHAMTTIATGGFSTSDKSFAAFDSLSIDIIAITGMLMGSLPFVLILKTLQGDRWSLWKDSQVRMFLVIAALAVLVATYWLHDDGRTWGNALRAAGFNVISVITGTGYASENYAAWGAFAVPMFFFMMFIGGCAGSATCGIKVFRFQVLYYAAIIQIRHLIHPRGVFIPYYNNKPVSDDVILSVLGFFFVFGICYAALALILGMLGLDFLTAISSAASSMSNVGPGLGNIVGPAGTYGPLPDSAKWFLSGGMLLGRLELFTVLVIFTRSFWRD